VPPDADPAADLLPISDYFDRKYSAAERYWWRNGDPHATDPAKFRSSLLTQLTLLAIKGRAPGSALDIGAGEGADSIRLARLGYKVTAVEISAVAGEKIQRFAAEAGVDVSVEISDIGNYAFGGEFDIVICNGVLHYVADKDAVIAGMQAATCPGGLNVVSLWSTYTSVPECHNRVPVYCDDEDGVVTRAYESWKTFLYLDRDKTETAHDEMEAHSHSHIKLIAEKPL
jgi:SAM-dependent methyltransferase